MTCNGNSVPRKLKVLCLHGYSQNKDFFKMKLGSLRKAVKNKVEFEFIDGPHIVENRREEDHDGESRAWWLTESHNLGVGLTESIELVKTTLLEKGPFDGILGFSQGAAFLGLLSSFIATKQIDAPDIKFVVLVAGYKFMLHENSYTDVNTPSLHVIGDTDSVILKERSEELMKHFTDFELFSHPGGHYVPASKEFRSRYVNFFDKFLKG
uniref:Ovarian cancer-associated gene 2 n=2 Tax=Lygus hesperus TaxID=30085 RepID=A0A0A9XGB6_LYGHE